MMSWALVTIVVGSLCLGCSVERNDELLRATLWKGSYENQEVSIEFKVDSTLVIDYGSMGSRLRESYYIRDSLLFVGGKKHSIIEELTRTTLRLLPAAETPNADIDLIHTLTFTRSVHRQEKAR